MTQSLASGTKSFIMLDRVTATGASDWYILPQEKTFSVQGIGTATVDIEYKTFKNQDAQTLYSFTADGNQANSDALYMVRANVSAYTSGTITVGCCIHDE